MKKVMFIIVAGVAVLTACKKDEKSTQEMVMGRWKIVSKINHEYTNGNTQPVSKDTTDGTSADYYDFRNDGKVYIDFDDDLDTLAYKVISNTRIKMGSDTSDIRTLTGNSFITFLKKDHTGGRTESLLTLQK